MNELQTARQQEHAARDLMRSLDARIILMKKGVATGRFEHDEVIQIAHSVRSLGVQRDRARDDWMGGRRICAGLRRRPR